MESSEADPVDGPHPLDSAVKDIVGTDVEDCNSQELMEDDAKGESLYYVELQGPSEHEVVAFTQLIYQNEDGFFYLMAEDSNGQPLEQALANATVVFGNGSQGAEQLIQTEDVSQENEENYIYIKNESTEPIIKSENCSNEHKSENFCQEISEDVNIDDSAITLNNDHLQNEDAKFNSNSVVNPSDLVLAPEDTKHQKLMQLAQVAGLQLQSVDHKSLIMNDNDSPLSEVKTSVIVTQNPIEETQSLTLTSPGVKDLHAINNTVSVIHTTSPELQENLEREVRHIATSGISYVENYNIPQKDGDLPLVYAEVSRDSLPDRVNTCHISLKIDGSNKDFEDHIPSNTTLEDSIQTEVKLDEKLSMNTLADETMVVDTSLDDEKVEEADENYKLKEGYEYCLSGGDSPVNFFEKSENLENSEVNESMDADNDSQRMIVEDDKTKQVDTDTSEVSCPSESHKIVEQTEESHINQEPHSEKFEVHNERDSEYTFTENDAVNLDGPESKALSSLCTARYSLFTRRSQAKTLFSTLSTDGLTQNFEITSKRSTKYDNICPQSESMSIGNKGESRTLSSEDKVSSESIEADSVVESERLAHSKNIDSSAAVPLLVTDMCPDIPFELEKASSSVESGKADGQLKIVEAAQTANSVTETYANSSQKDVEDNVIETCVKPPKKTYDRIKVPFSDGGSIQNDIELFSDCAFNLSECDKEIQRTEDTLNMDQQENFMAAKSSVESVPSSSGASLFSPLEKDVAESSLNDDVHSSSHNLLEKVSATYDRKNKTLLPSKKGFKSQTLRSRPLSKKPHLNGCEKSQSLDVESSSYDASSSENLPWGDVLLRTEFQSSVSNDTASNTASKSLVKPPSSRKKQVYSKARNLSKKINSDFDSLLLPGKAKCRNNKRKLSASERKSKKVKRFRGTMNTAKRMKKNYPIKRYAKNTVHSQNQRSRCQKEKRAELSFIQPRDSPDKGSETGGLNYCCSNCDFSTIMVDNLIEHLKYCAKSPSPIDFSVDDMEKRQRIRGDLDALPPEGLMDFNSSLESVRGECSGLSNNHLSDSDDDEVDLDFMKKNKYGYGEDDVVWTKVEDRFWPGLVCELREKKAFVKLINFPTEKKGLKKNAERVHTFDDAKWNKMLLTEAENLPNNEIFVKAVQTSETFVRKKWLGQDVKGKDFFSLPDEIEFTTDNESSDCNINEDSDITDPYSGMKPSRRARYEKIDVEKVKNYIIDGHLDSYVVDIYNQKEHSERHKKYMTEGKTDASLTQKSWFGPCENIIEGILVDHFHTLFLKEIGESFFFLSYILQVWIPEAIVKAISVLQDISFEEAEELFDSEDSLGKDDPSIEDIDEMYF